MYFSLMKSYPFAGTYFCQVSGEWRPCMVQEVCTELAMNGTVHLKRATRNTLLQLRVSSFEVVLFDCGYPFEAMFAHRGASGLQNPISECPTALRTRHESSGAHLGLVFDHFRAKCDGFMIFAILCLRNHHLRARTFYATISYK